VVDLTVLWVRALQQWVAPQKPGQRQTETGLRPLKMAGLNRICCARRRIPASMATLGILAARVPGSRKATSPITVALLQDLAATPETRITLIVPLRPVQEITVRGIR
jgi:hypothetical protein